MLKGKRVELRTDVDNAAVRRGKFLTVELSMPNRYYLVLAGMDTEGRSSLNYTNVDHIVTIWEDNS